MLAYRDIERYRKSARKHRKSIGNHFIETYLKEGSPLELNITGAHAKYLEYRAIINESELIPPNTLFNDLKIMCLSNMLDVFGRLVNSNKKIREIVENWRSTNASVQ